MTMESWVKIDSSNSMPWNGLLINKSNNTGYVMFMDSNDRPGFVFHTPNGYLLVMGSDILQPNQWYHIAMTYNNGIGEIWVNGVKVGNGSITPGNILPSVQNLWIGAGQTSPTGSFIGTLDELIIYGRALTGAEIIQRYDATK